MKTEEPGVVVCVTVVSMGQGIIRPIKAKHPITSQSGNLPNGDGACVAATSGSSLIRLTRTLLRILLFAWWS